MLKKNRSSPVSRGLQLPATPEHGTASGALISEGASAPTTERDPAGDSLGRSDWAAIGQQSPTRPSSAERRHQQRTLARQLSRDFGVTFDLAFKAVRAGVHGRCAELAETIGECRTLGFIAAVQTLAGSRAPKFRAPGREASKPAIVAPFDPSAVPP
jgi:hypothetical protein